MRHHRYTINLGMNKATCGILTRAPSSDKALLSNNCASTTLPSSRQPLEMYIWVTSETRPRAPHHHKELRTLNTPTLLTTRMGCCCSGVGDCCESYFMSFVLLLSLPLPAKAFEVSSLWSYDGYLMATSIDQLHHWVINDVVG